MTRDEMREKCIDVISAELVEAFNYDPGKIDPLAAAILDALPMAEVRVVPAEATEEMVAAGVHHRDTTQGGLAETFNVMAAAGDLTNSPERK